MITLYTHRTPNGQKISIMLEEIGLPYEVRTIDISANEQFTPEFLALNPNNKIPVIVDSEGPDGAGPFTVIESGAILVYLAEKAASPLLPTGARARSEVLQWLMFQIGGLGPMLGQAHHFRLYAPEKVPYGIERYSREAERLYGVMNKRLGDVPYLGGAVYSIADIASFPWVSRHEGQGIDLDAFPNVARWHDELADRPAVARGMAVPRPVVPA